MEVQCQISPSQQSTHELLKDALKIDSQQRQISANFIMNKLFMCKIQRQVKMA